MTYVIDRIPMFNVIKQKNYMFDKSVGISCSNPQAFFDELICSNAELFIILYTKIYITYK